jgi:hypothetical protein
LWHTPAKKVHHDASNGFLAEGNPSAPYLKTTPNPAGNWVVPAHPMSAVGELKAPPAWELACWGERGLDQLVDATLKAPTSKNISLCLQILTFLSSGDDFSIAPVFCDEPRRAKLHSFLRTNPALRAYAKSKLLAFVLSVDDEDDLLEMAEHYGLQVVGFDWLARRGRAIRANLIKTGVAVRQHARVM